MKIQHTAMLVLLGWYLMIPYRMAEAPRPNSQSPLNQWYKFKEYPTQNYCEDMRDRAIEAFQNPSALPNNSESEKKVAAMIEGAGPTGRAEIGAFLKASKCVASNDPALAN